MLALLAVFLAPVFGQNAMSCQMNASSTGCQAPAQFAHCLAVCGLYQTNTSCATVSGCSWANNVCSPVNASIMSRCYNSMTSADCTSEPLCSWQTGPCKFGGQCSANNNSLACGSFTDPSTCAAQLCQWTPHCQNSNPCDLVGTSEASCHCASGCFWKQSYVSDGSTGFTYSQCSPCFSDPPATTDNFFATIQAHVGFTCYFTGTSETFLAASTGSSACSSSSGVQILKDLTNCTSPAPTAAPTTAAPTTNVTMAPTTAAPSTAAPTMASNTTTAPTMASNSTTTAPTMASNATTAPTDAAANVNGAEQLAMSFAPLLLLFCLF